MFKIIFPPAVARWVSVAALLFLANKGIAYTNGIYAEFNTSMGSYTCVLNYAESPKAVANFIGLATGQRAWLSLPAGVIKTNPFYNGITFHRVVTNFVIQAGSPNGQGTDGPGYAFVDEITNTLQFNKFGVLAMANSGPDSNGSQFFVLATNSYPSLNNGYTIFGSLYGGSNVIYAINHVATDANNKPLANVYINNVNIQRVGTEANAFDIAAQGLPLVTNLDLKIAQAGTNVSLTFSNRLYADNRLFNSTNLINWTGATLGIEVVAPVTNITYSDASSLKKFFRMAQVQYPPALFVPKTVLNKTITLNFSAGNGTFVIMFNNNGGGSYTWTGGTSGAVNFYNWIQDPYRGRLRPIWLQNFGYIMELHLGYDTATTGTFKGTAFVDYLYPSSVGSFPVSGTFSSAP